MMDKRFIYKGIVPLKALVKNVLVGTYIERNGVEKMRSDLVSNALLKHAMDNLPKASELADMKRYDTNKILSVKFMGNDMVQVLFAERKYYPPNEPVIMSIKEFNKIVAEQGLLGKSSTHMVVDEEHIYTGSSVASWYTPEEWKKISELSRTTENRTGETPLLRSKNLVANPTYGTGYSNIGHKIVQFGYDRNNQKRVPTREECTKFLEEILKDCQLYHENELGKRKKH